MGMTLFAFLCLCDCVGKSSSIVKRGPQTYREIEHPVVRHGADLYHAVYQELIAYVHDANNRREHAERACENAKEYSMIMHGAGEEELSLLVSMLTDKYPDMKDQVEKEVESFRIEYDKDKSFRKTYDFCVEKLNGAQ
jgi:hypothetical protein